MRDIILGFVLGMTFIQIIDVFIIDDIIRDQGYMKGLRECSEYFTK